MSQTSPVSTSHTFPFSFSNHKEIDYTRNYKIDANILILYNYLLKHGYEYFVNIRIMSYFPPLHSYIVGKYCLYFLRIFFDNLWSSEHLVKYDSYSSNLHILWSFQCCLWQLSFIFKILNYQPDSSLLSSWHYFQCSLFQVISVSWFLFLI